MAPWTHLVRFIAEEDGHVHLGQVDPKITTDVGIEVFNGRPVVVKLISGSIFDGVVTEKTMTIRQVPKKNTPDNVEAFMLTNSASLTHFY